MRIDSTTFDLGEMDRMACQDTSIHRLDPRAKVLTTILFILCVVSFDRYSVSGLMPFFIYPLAVGVLGNLGLGKIARKVILISPFALLIGIFNPMIDRETLFRIGAMNISGGWVSFASIILRFLLTVGAVLILIASTGFNSVCMALEKMGAPRVFIMQLLFLYRYLFLLADQGSRIMRARSLRSFQGKGTGMRVFGSMAGSLLLRTLNRAQRIHLAMLCRGFDGTLRILKPMRIGGREIAFFLGWSALFVSFRSIPLARLLGKVFWP